MGYDEASTSTLALLVSAFIFTVSFATIIQTGVHLSSSGSDAERAANQEATAHRLAETIFGSPGQGWYSSLSCPQGVPDAALLTPDALKRLGLRTDVCPNQAVGPAHNLSFDKLGNLGKGLLATDPANDAVDYAEARASLGLSDPGTNFHLRTWPLLASARQALDEGYQDPYSRVAYIGDYDTLTENSEIGYSVARTCGRTDGLTSADAWVDITNNGTTSTAFEVTFSVPLEEHTVEIVKHTGLVLPLTTTHVSATLPKTVDWQWDGSPVVDVEISDTMRFLGACQANLAGITMTAATTNRLFVVHAEKLEEVLTGLSVSPKVYYEVFNGEGDSLSYSSWKIDIENTLGLVVASDSNLHSRGWESFTLTGALAYQAKLKSTLGTLLSQDTINVVTTAIAPFTPVSTPVGYLPAASVGPEIAYVDSLMETFLPKAYALTYTSLDVPYQAGGDVYPDLKNVLNDDLPDYLIDSQGTQDPNDDVPTLANYNLLVVGSGVDHNAMTSAAAKQTIKDWVYAGGFLLVLGSEDQTVSWLQPIFHSGITTGSGGISTPDPSHPVLNTPNKLDYLSYSTGGQVWSYSGNNGDYFTHVIKQGSDDVLAISNAGVFGSGRVLLTSYQPYDLQGNGATGPCDPAALQAACQALQVFQNFFTLNFQELYLDYGPSIPNGVPVGVASQIVRVWHPQMGRLVELVAQVYVF